MAAPLSSLKAFASLSRWPSCDTERVFAGNLRSSALVLPRRPLPSSIVAFARRRSNNSANSSKKKKKKSLRREESREGGEDISEDAFEALFSMLAEDLKNDDSSIDDDVDDDISEEDFEKLQRELEEVLGIGGDDDDDVIDVDIINSTGDDDDVEDPIDIKEDDEEEEEEEEEERPLTLKNWQFRRLARALKHGRRKTSIKTLSAELCLDRAIVLELLRDPPPNLVMMSASLPDEPAAVSQFPQTNPSDLNLADKPIVDGAVNSKIEKEVPVHVMRHSWTAQKRLKKVHVETLERVYRRTKRPTNTMVSSIVQVTNLPRKRVVKWFEDKRNEDGVPEQRAPFQRSVPETVSS